MSFENTPSRWKNNFVVPNPSANKYTRGHTVVAAGSMVGAAKLAVRAARRTGSGLVTVACEPEQKLAFECDWPGAIVAPYNADDRFTKHLTDPRKNTFVLGCGGGKSESLKAIVLNTLAMGTEKNVVLDAEALTLFAENSDELIKNLHQNCVLTPHAGEFERIFPDLVDAPSSTLVLAAAKRTGCTVLLKGSVTYIASPEGELVENKHATPWLATAGTGDVLAGIIGGLMAQGFSAFEAAQAGAWIHGEAALKFGGAGLIAEDIIENIPAVLQKLIK